MFQAGEAPHLLAVQERVCYNTSYLNTDCNVKKEGCICPIHIIIRMYRRKILPTFLIRRWVWNHTASKIRRKSGN